MIVGRITLSFSGPGTFSGVMLNFMECKDPGMSLERNFPYNPILWMGFSTINPTLERGLGGTPFATENFLRELGGWDPRTWFQSWFPRPGVVKHPFQTVPFVWLRKWG